MDPTPPTATAPLRPVAVVLNGAAGALLDGAHSADTLRAAFASAGLAPQFVPQDAGTLPERVRQAVASGAEVVVAAGGDGTIACTAQVLAGTGVALGILPFGTMNLLARDLGIPIGDPAAAIRVLGEGAARAIDVGEVNGHVFLCGSVLGLPARLARIREEGRGGFAIGMWARMARAGLRAVARGRRLRVAVRLHDRTVRARASALTITPNPLDDASGRSFGRTRLDGGELAVYIVRRLGWLALLRLAWRGLVGGVQHDSAVQELRARRLVIAAERTALRVMNDGEVMLLRPPLRYRIRPQVLRVIAPAAAPQAAPAPP